MLFLSVDSSPAHAYPLFSNRIEDIDEQDERELEQSSAAANRSDAPELSTMELIEVCKRFIEHLRSGSAPWLLQRLNTTYGPMPADPRSFSYWMALVMPIDEYEKARLLPIRSVRLRLKLIVHWIEQLRSSWW